MLDGGAGTVRSTVYRIAKEKDERRRRGGRSGSRSGFGCLSEVG